jgi:MHS family proline/betaine transporter-like MFS transporter
MERKMNSNTYPDRISVPPVPGTAKAEQRRAAAAGMVGYILEWFDFGIYGFLAPIIAQNFFPAHDSVTSLLVAFAVFGVGCVARPVGSVVLGRIADVKGRHGALATTMILMAASTVMMGLLPTYSQIGIAAPILLVAARLLQGFAAGGEWGTAAAFLVEWGGSNRRGFLGAFQQSSIAAGLMLASFVAAILSTFIGHDGLAAWGWRIPFLLGIVLGPIGFYVRRNVKESPMFIKAAQSTEKISSVFFWKSVLHGFCFLVLWFVSSYMVCVYMPSFAARYAHIGETASLWAGSLSLAAVAILTPLAGLLSDRIGRKPLLRGSCLFFVIFSYPAYRLIVAGIGMGNYMLIQMLLTLAFILFSGCGPAALAEMFPTKVRSLGVSIGGGVASILGGFTPFLTTWTISLTGSSASAGWLLAGSAALTLPVVIVMRDHSKQVEI